MPAINNHIDEPLDRLEQRALDGLRFGISALKRLHRTLPRWIRKDGEIDPAKAIAAITAIDTALATMSPVNMQTIAKRVRRRTNEAA
jgi:hypothetical protein